MGYLGVGCGNSGSGAGDESEGWETGNVGVVSLIK